MRPELTCGARTMKGGKCGRAAGWGTDHGPRDGMPGVGRCRLHGGSTPTHQKAAALEQASALAVVMGMPLDVEPWEALAQCVRIAAGEVAYCSAMVAALAPDDAVGPVVTSHTRPVKRERGADHQTKTVTEVRHEAPALHIWIKARAAAMERLARFSKMSLDAGVDERQVRVAEGAGQAMAQLIRGVLGDLGIPLEAPATRDVVTKHLRLLEAPGHVAAVPPDGWGHRR